MLATLFRSSGRLFFLALLGCRLATVQAQVVTPPQNGIPQAAQAGYFGFRPSFTAAQVEAWKRKYPFQSIRERLQYEAPLVTDATRAKSASHRGAEASIRAHSLEMLHSMEVEKFIQASGNGFERRPTPAGGHFLELPAPQPPEYARLAPLSAAEAEMLPTESLGDEVIAADLPFAAAPLLPLRRDLVGLNSHVVHNFADTPRFGLVKSLDQVAGFEPHAFRRPLQMPADAADRPKPGEEPRTWKLARLELVSLLKHPTPRVYESEQLPTMEELSSSNAKTRPLNAFETAALVVLREGHHVQTSSTPNRITMLGPIRANQACMQCHEVPFDTLLGAFSYELRRDPPVALTRNAAVQ